MKVQLKCTYGDKSPGTVIDVKADVAETLIAEGNAIDAKKLETTKDSKEVIALTKRVATLEGQVETLTEEKATLEGQVETLTDKK